MTSLWKNEEAKVIAERLIPAHHDHLAEAKFEYLFTDADVKKRGCRVLGKVRTTNDLLKYFSEADFIMIFPSVAWKRLNEKQKPALVDHELCHCAKKEQKGEIIYFTRGHSIEEFSAVVDRHGLWIEAVQRFAVTIQHQLELGIGGEKAGKLRTVSKKQAGKREAEVSGSRI